MSRLVTLRAKLKRYLPSPLRKVIRMVVTYFQRMGRWAIILMQMRGVNANDQMKLFASALAAPFNSLSDLDSWKDPKLLYDLEVVVFNIGRFKLRKNTDDLWHVLPWREYAIFRELRKRLKPGSTFVDAGANIGIYTILASRLVGVEGVVISVEMIPGTAAILQRHIDLNGCQNVKLVENALSDQAGETVVATIPEGKYGQASIAHNNLKERVGEKISIQTTTLDVICAPYPVIDLMKMDLEGVEALALSGAINTLPKIRALIFESVHDRSDEASELVKEAGFYLNDLTGKDLLALRYESAHKIL